MSFVTSSLRKQVRKEYPYLKYQSWWVQIKATLLGTKKTMYIYRLSKAGTITASIKYDIVSLDGKNYLIRFHRDSVGGECE